MFRPEIAAFRGRDIPRRNLISDTSRTAQDRLSTGHIRSRSLNRALLWSAFAFAVTFATYTFFWALYIKPFYFPCGDNFSVLVNSLPPFHPSASAWFLHGFQNYFDVYPDMSLHATNFIRPVVNGTFFLDWFVYGAHWERYLLTSYAILGLIGAITCFLSNYTLRLGWRLSLLATFCVVLAPSIDTGAIFDPTFAFDLLGGLFVLSAVVALIYDALLPAWILLALAVFTKETTLFAPAVAATVLLVRRNDKSPWKAAITSAAFLLPLIAWFTLRRYDFHGDEGVYVFMDGSAHGPIHVMLVRIILGLTTWPLAATVYGNSIPVQLGVLQTATNLLNVLFWLTLSIILLRLLWRKLRENRFSKAEILLPFGAQGDKYSIAVLSLFCASSLLTPLALNVPRRFGGVFFPLFVLCFSVIARRANNTFVKLASVGIVAAVGIVGAMLIVYDFQYSAPKTKSTWAMAKNYVFQLSTSTEPELFSIDDLSGRYSSTEYVQRFAGYKGHFVRVNDIHWDTACTLPLRTDIAYPSPGTVIVTSIVPASCGDHVFDSVFPPIDPKRTSFTRDLPFARLHYEFQRSKAISPSDVGSNQLRLQLDSFLPGSSLLIADPAALRYLKFPMSPAGNSGQ
jgi:hypothetical protein